MPLEVPPLVFGAAGGKIGYEVAVAVKPPSIGGGMNIGGQSGRWIEIIGLKSKWD